MRAQRPDLGRTIRLVSPTADEIVRTAAHWIDRGVRLDTRTFAAELGISRSTLFRRVGQPGGAARRRALVPGGPHDGGRGPAVGAGRGRRRAQRGRGAALPRGHATTTARPSRATRGFRKLLDDEPTLAIRVLTDPRGRVQPRVIVAHLDLLAPRRRRRRVHPGGRASRACPTRSSGSARRSCTRTCWRPGRPTSTPRRRCWPRWWRAGCPPRTLVKHIGVVFHQLGSAAVTRGGPDAGPDRRELAARTTGIAGISRGSGRRDPVRARCAATATGSRSPAATSR